MDITPSLPAERLSQFLQQLPRTDTAVRNLLATLRPGQSLQALVVAAPRVDVAQLLIEGLPVTARTGRPLIPGDRLLLTVIKDGPAPELQIKAAPRAANSADVLRVSLPRQLPLQESLRGLTQLAERAMPLINDAARQALRSLLDRPLPLRELSAKTLQQSVKDSGLFTEANMARGQAPAPGDRKTLLMQLAAALPGRQTPAQNEPPAALTRALLTRVDALPTPLSKAMLLGSTLKSAQLLAPNAALAAATALPTQDPERQMIDRLWRLVEASLARIQTHQAASLPREDRTQPAWQLEIPIALPGGPTQVIDLRIQAETSQEAEQDADAGWLVTIGFVFRGLGPVKAGVRLAQGRVSTSFWCEQPQTAALFEKQLPRLQASLEAAGLEVGHLAASQGQPPDAQQPPADQLLDERV